MTAPVLQTLDYFYDRQQLRFIEQIIRAFSGIQYMSGARAGLEPQLVTVPCRMATTNLTAASILRNQSEDTLLVTPMITVWQTDLKVRTEDLQNRNHVDSLQVVERAIDPLTGAYTGPELQCPTPDADPIQHDDRNQRMDF